jgi:hypothetical protein
MVKTTAGVAARLAVAAMMMMGVTPRTDAAGSDRVVVLHVTDRAGISTSALVEAETQVALVYDAIQVQVLWTEGAAALAPTDGALHLDVVILSEEAVQRKCLADRLTDDVVGSASGPTKRAYIFVGRIADRSRVTGSFFSTVLALVIAHEVGHLLLPPLSHSPTGIMRAHWDGRVLGLPRFTGKEGTAIRASLAVANDN